MVRERHLVPSPREGLHAGLLAERQERFRAQERDSVGSGVAFPFAFFMEMTMLLEPTRGPQVARAGLAVMAIRSLHLDVAAAPPPIRHAIIVDWPRTLSTTCRLPLTWLVSRRSNCCSGSLIGGMF